MLKRFRVTNYVGTGLNYEIDLSNIQESFDFNIECVNNGLARVVLILGEAGTGKTVLGKALTSVYTPFIKESYRPDYTSTYNLTFNFGDGDIECIVGVSNENPVNVHIFTDLDENKSRRMVADYLKSMSMLELQDMYRDGFFTELTTNLYDELRLNLVNSYLKKLGLRERLITKQVGSDKTICIEKESNCKTIVISIDNMSTCLREVLNLFMELECSKQQPRFVYIDNFASTMDFDVASRMLGVLKKGYPNIQFLCTTTKTSLLSNEFSRPDIVFESNTDGKFKNLTSLTDRELREAHNIEKMYIAGAFLTR